MSVILLIPTVLSFLLLGAHFLRDGSMDLVVVSLLIPLILLVRRRWVSRVVQIILVLAALEWAWTVWEIAENRIARNEPLGRMVVILGAVALWTVCSAILFETRTLRQCYRRIQTDAGGS
jgi:hypothetical protein